MKGTPIRIIGFNRQIYVGGSVDGIGATVDGISIRDCPRGYKEAKKNRKKNKKLKESQAIIRFIRKITNQPLADIPSMRSEHYQTSSDRYFDYEGYNNNAGMSIVRTCHPFMLEPALFENRFVSFNTVTKPASSSISSSTYKQIQGDDDSSLQKLLRQVNTEPTNMSKWIQLIHLQEQMEGPRPVSKESKGKGNNQKEELRTPQPYLERRLSIIEKALSHFELSIRTHSVFDTDTSNNCFQKSKIYLSILTPLLRVLRQVKDSPFETMKSAFFESKRLSVRQVYAMRVRQALSQAVKCVKLLSTEKLQLISGQKSSKLSANNIKQENLHYHFGEAWHFVEQVCKQVLSMWGEVVAEECAREEGSSVDLGNLIVSQFRKQCQNAQLDCQSNEYFSLALLILMQLLCYYSRDHPELGTASLQAILQYYIFPSPGASVITPSQSYSKLIMFKLYWELSAKAYKLGEIDSASGWRWSGDTYNTNKSDKPTSNQSFIGCLVAQYSSNSVMYLQNDSLSNWLPSHPLHREGKFIISHPKSFILFDDIKHAIQLFEGSVIAKRANQIKDNILKHQLKLINVLAQWLQLPGFSTPFQPRFVGARCEAILDWWLGQAHHQSAVSPTLQSPFIPIGPTWNLNTRLPKRLTAKIQFFRRIINKWKQKIQQQNTLLTHKNQSKMATNTTQELQEYSYYTAQLMQSIVLYSSFLQLSFKFQLLTQKGQISSNQLASLQFNCCELKSVRSLILEFQVRNQIKGFLQQSHKKRKINNLSVSIGCKYINKSSALRQFQLILQQVITTHNKHQISPSIRSLNHVANSIVFSLLFFHKYGLNSSNQISASVESLWGLVQKVLKEYQIISIRPDLSQQQEILTIKLLRVYYKRNPSSFAEATDSPLQQCMGANQSRIVSLLERYPTALGQYLKKQLKTVWNGAASVDEVSGDITSPTIDAPRGVWNASTHLDQIMPPNWLANNSESYLRLIVSQLDRIGSCRTQQMYLPAELVRLGACLSAKLCLNDMPLLRHRQLVDLVVTKLTGTKLGID